MRLKLNVNGDQREAEAQGHESLLTVLRERLGLWGSKNACEQGECGSCSVLMDGQLVCACLVLAGAAESRDIRTVEDLADGEHMHPVQRAFVDAGAVQCGFCTPGLIVATAALLRDNPEPTEPEIREALSGNICRCTGYGRILEAVRVSATKGYGDDRRPD
jgi:carbon-monoxide dehydrogenase small subunit